MKLLVILGHPSEESFNHAIAETTVNKLIESGYEVMIAYEFKADDKGDGVPVGLLKARTGIVFNTSNTNEERELAVFKDPLETIWKNCIFDLCGIRIFYRKMFRIVVTSTEAERKRWLHEVEEIF